MAAAIPRHLLETLVNCPACAQRYTEPKVLPTCGHTICTNCLAQEWSSLLNESAETKISRLCPLKTCRKEICSSIVDHRDLPLNQTIVDLINSWSFQVEATGPCQICHQSPSFVKCSHCSLFACFECANQHRRETLTTLTNQINTLEQDYLAMNDQIDHAKENFRLQREKSLKHIQSYYQHLIDQLHQAQKIEEEKLDHQGNLYEQELNQFIDEQKIHSERIHHTIQELRTTITDWSTVEQFKHLQTKLSEIEEEIHHRNDYFHQHLPEMKLVEPHHPLNNDEFPLHQSKVNSSTTATRLPVDDLSSATTSSTHHDPIKIISSSTTSTGHRSIRKHSHHTNHYKSLNTLHDHSHASVNLNNDPRVTPTLLEDEAKINTNQILHNHHQPRSHSSMSTNLPSKTVSSSIADLSLTSSKISSTTIRLSSFQSKLDYCLLESYKKIPLSQSFDWGILAVTNTDLILLYNKDKTSLVIYDALGQENERIQWSDGDIKDLCIYRDDTIVIVGEHKQASKPIECKLYVCNLSRKQLERERVVERGLNCQRIASDEEYLFYASEKGCNKSKISVFDHELQLQITFEAGVEIRSLAVDKQCCYVLGKRREREMGRYFLEKRHKNGQLIRRIDLYELNVDNMNRVIPDPISRGVIVTDGGNKKIWAIGPEGEKKAVQYRPWPWSIAFLTNDTLLVLHAGCLTFHGVNHAKLPANSSKTRTIHTNLETV